MRAAVAKTAPDDPVLRDYVKYVIQPLSEELALAIAKGGEEFITQRLAEGKSDQISRVSPSAKLAAHLVNGLLPVIHIAHELGRWGAPRFRYFDETSYRLFCVGYTLHDWLKLPEVDRWLEQEGLAHNTVNPARHLALVEDIFRQWCERLGLDRFLEPVGGLERWLHDLIYLASNTQVRWGTMLNLAALPRLALNGRARQLATDLCTLADRIAYIARTPRDVATHRSITEYISNLSNGEARLIYHHVAENRGALTNFIHNAATAALRSPDCVALLFAPSGVVYLCRGTPPAWNGTRAATVAEDVVRRIRQSCGKRLKNSLTGFSRDGKGLKYAPYYELHFSPAERIRVAARAAFVRISDLKKPSSGTRFAKIAEKAMAPAGVDVRLPDDIRVDQLAEFCTLAGKVAGEAAPGLDATGLLLAELGLAGERATFDAIGAFPNAGGVAYNWYYAAGTYLKHGHGAGAGPDEWRALIDGLAARLAEALEQHAVEHPGAARGDGWDDVRVYVQRVLKVGPQGDAVAGPAADIRQAVEAELERYQMAKAQGRGVTSVCSLCSSSYEVHQQREAGILFAPQVYSNKQPLHGSKALRSICRLCEIEMMLRQILMNRQAVSGGRFEGQRVRYLYFYPTYFFTPETLAQFDLAYLQLKRLSFTSVRKALLSDDNNGQPVLHVTAGDFQRLGPLMLDPTPVDPAQDRLFRMQFPEDEPITFYFLGVPPPGREAKDAEAWVNPAFLALVLPLALDIKVVATESPLPLLNEADELDEAVMLDAPHDFVKDVVGRERIGLEGLLDRLQALTATYLVHMDANANFARLDYRWHALPPLARNISSDTLWTFAYLKKWQRNQNGLEAITADKAHLYLQLAGIFDQLKGRDSMSYARDLTTRYMRFYRQGRSNSNSILRPIMIAAEAVLESDPRLFDQDGLVEVVRGRLADFMERVGSHRADGRYAPGSTHESRAAAIDSFSRYFVSTIFCDALHGERAALRGQQLNLLKSACEVIYRDLAAKEWQDRRAAGAADEEAADETPIEREEA